MANEQYKQRTYIPIVTVQSKDGKTTEVYWTYLKRNTPKFIERGSSWVNLLKVGERFML
jgi:hypothetical protein